MVNQLPKGIQDSIIAMFECGLSVRDTAKELEINRNTVLRYRKLARQAEYLAMTNRIIDLYNDVKFEEGDAILELLPDDIARRLLDWYFDEDAPNVAPDFQRPSRNERPCSPGVAGQSERTQDEAAPDHGAQEAPIESEAPADKASPCNASGGTS